MTQYCNTLTNLRKELGNKLEILITKELKDLNMNNVVFKVKYDKLDYLLLMDGTK